MKLNISKIKDYQNQGVVSLNQAIDINGVNKLIINKLDVLEKVGVYKIYDGMELLEFNSIDDMEYWITDNLKSKDVEIIFSRNKDGF